MKEIRKKLRFNIDVVNHCNLNCVGCGHFSPLAEEYYLPVESFEKDCKRLSELTGGDIERMEIMGGEPLLHPNIIELLKIARYNFSGEINICTNGLLVEAQPDEFFKTCHDLKISIAITVYPIRLNWKTIEEKLRKYSVNLIKVGTKNQSKRIWYKNKRDLTGNQDVNENFRICRWGNNCIILEGGRLATCVMPFKTRYYNRYYGKDTFRPSIKDSISIYEVNDIEEILNFLARPITCCRYCLPNCDQEIDWSVSKKDIEEWS